MNTKLLVHSVPFKPNQSVFLRVFGLFLSFLFLETGLSRPSPSLSWVFPFCLVKQSSWVILAHEIRWCLADWRWFDRFKVEISFQIHNRDSSFDFLENWIRLQLLFGQSENFQNLVSSVLLSRLVFDRWELFSVVNRLVLLFFVIFFSIKSRFNQQEMRTTF